MNIINQKQQQKRRVNPGVKSFSGALQLRGLDPYGFHAERFPTFTAVVAAGGASVDFELTSGDFDQYEICNFVVSNAKGEQAILDYVGPTGAESLDTSGLDLSYNNNLPIAIGIIYREKAGVSLDDNNRTLSYEALVDVGSFTAGVTVDTALFLDTNISGIQIDLAAAYTTGPDQVAVDITAISAVGLDFEVFQNGVSAGTGTIGADGTAQFVDAGTLAPGSYTYKVEFTTEGQAKGSFAEVVVVVA
jgi:hypothetical protein